MEDKEYHPDNFIDPPTFYRLGRNLTEIKGIQFEALAESMVGDTQESNDNLEKWRSETCVLLYHKNE